MFIYSIVLGFKFWLRGNVGDEVVSIVEDNYVTTITLHTTYKLFETHHSKIQVLFTNDNGPRDVFFRSDVPTTIKSLRFKEWKCEQSIEQTECKKVRNGQFSQSDTYTITFQGMTL